MSAAQEVWDCTQQKEPSRSGHCAYTYSSGSALTVICENDPVALIPETLIVGEEVRGEDLSGIGGLLVAWLLRFLVISNLRHRDDHL